MKFLLTFSSSLYILEEGKLILDGLKRKNKKTSGALR
jgi:hypothetical protein